jgi:hypothetical protein
VTVPNLLLSSMFAPFPFVDSHGEHGPALQNFHVTEMAL